jgi:hypothetical protein
MTGRERRIAELAAQDLEAWARELPLGSETRRDLQQTARAYRLAARAGVRGIALRVVPDAGAQGEVTGTAGEAVPRTGRDRAALTEVSRGVDRPLDHGA